MIKKIKELLKSDHELNMELRDDKKLEKYIVAKAKKHLDNKNGGIEDEIVLGWARHFYIETQEVIDKELKKSKPKKEAKPVVKNVEKPSEPTIFDFGAMENVV